MHLSAKVVGVLLGLVLIVGCSATQTIESVPQGERIEKVYIRDNPDVRMEELKYEIADQIEALGFAAEIYSGSRPASAVHYMTYTANWSWDLAVYLTYFRAVLHGPDGEIGRVEYDARRANSPSRFGSTAGKIEPLLEELFKEVPPNR